MHVCRSLKATAPWESFLLLQECGEDNWNLEVGVGKGAVLSSKNLLTIDVANDFSLVCALTVQPQVDFRITLLHFNFFPVFPTRIVTS